jgi:photosystem II stability/assembly factor-like uncharacterized protein
MARQGRPRRTASSPKPLSLRERVAEGRVRAWALHATTTLIRRLRRHLLPEGEGLRLALWMCVTLFIVQQAANADWRSDNRPMQEDAELTDVFFVDAEHGWAVGDRGAIWQTVDGGHKWQLQETGLRARLESVHFTDANNGWAVGGTSQPYTHTNTGVLLRTRDGGRSWRQDTTQILPALKQVRFFGANNGWALGETSATFPTGVFSTDNGGRSWSPLVGTSVQSWSAGDFIDSDAGAVAGRRGSLAVVRRRGLEETRTPNLGLRGLKRLKLAHPTGGWLVGDGGLILQTQDAGRSWQMPADDASLVVGSDFDWQAVEARGSQCWIAGSPGTRVLHTADGGQSWQAFSTGQSLPITDLAFVDDQHGWAVGAMGLILSTSDGGKTWKRQRSAATRAAVLGLFSEPTSVPLELLARLSGNEGYLSAVELLNRRDLEVGLSDADTLADRAREAITAVGTSAVDTAWSFPLRQSGLALSSEQLVEGWDRTNDGRGIARLEAYIVRQIRCWRPDLIVTHAASLRGEDPLGHTINQLVLQAAEQAADATRYPEQMTQMGLEPWKAKKIIGSLPEGQLGSMNLTTSQLAPRLGCALADMAVGPRGLLIDEFEPTPSTRGFQLLIDHVPQGAGAADFMSGITLYPGGEARRIMGDSSDIGADLMRRIAHRHRNLQAILAHSEKAPGDSARFLAEIGELTSGLDETAAGDVLYQLAQSFYHRGQWEMAAETFNLLATKFPKHTLAPPSLVWLLRYWTSSEVAWQISRAKRTGATPALATPATAGISMSLAQRLPGTNDLAASGPRAGRLTPPEADPMQGADRLERASALAKFIEQTAPAVFSEPTVQFPLAMSLRSRGLPKQAERFYMTFVRTRPQDAWWSCAAGEQWLIEPAKGQPPKSIWQVAGCAAKPKLDGHLDDAVWKRATPVELHSPVRDDANWPAIALAAYDDEFLYLAVNCREAPGFSYAASTEPRPRDPDLSRSDRVDFYLDLDRDFATQYHVSIDHRGWVSEACWGAKSWNPQWFVACKHESGAWTAEAAIPWSELTGDRPRSRAAWAVGVQRVVPGVGFQSWTTPASTAVVPQGFGYAIFE